MWSLWSGEKAPELSDLAKMTPLGEYFSPEFNGRVASSETLDKGSIKIELISYLFINHSLSCRFCLLAASARRLPSFFSMRLTTYQAFYGHRKSRMLSGRDSMVGSEREGDKSYQIIYNHEEMLRIRRHDYWADYIDNATR